MHLRNFIFYFCIFLFLWGCEPPSNSFRNEDFGFFVRGPSGWKQESSGEATFVVVHFIKKGTTPRTMSKISVMADFLAASEDNLVSLKKAVQLQSVLLGEQAVVIPTDVPQNFKLKNYEWLYAEYKVKVTGEEKPFTLRICLLNAREQGATFYVAQILGPDETLGLIEDNLFFQTVQSLKKLPVKKKLFN